MKFSNFLFTEARDPSMDGQIIDEALKEAQLCDQLGMETLWLAEHHFDGNCGYVDPVTFAAAIAATTKQIKIGFAVAQVSLHHPVRLAENMAILDNMSHGRIIVGLGRGTAHNIYEYQGYDLDPHEAQERLNESQEIMMRCWTETDIVHEGKFWNLRIPICRPVPYTKPHPYVIRASSSEGSMVQLAKEGKPFMMNIQSIETIQHRMDLYRTTMSEAGYDDEYVQKMVDQCWVWRNIYVSDTDAKAEKIGLPAFKSMLEHRKKMREKTAKEQGLNMSHDKMIKAPAARTQPEHSLLCGSPATVAEEIKRIKDCNVGGLILTFRQGPMAYEDAAHSIELFMKEVAPEFPTQMAAE